MTYKVLFTKKAKTLLNKAADYLVNKKKNPDAAKHLLDSVGELFIRIGDNPYQFPMCRNFRLAQLKYREALVPDMKYLVIYKVTDHTVYILGIFHMLENYSEKI